MLMKNDSDRIIDLLVKQCDSIDSKITSYHLMGARVIGLGTAIVIGVLALAIKEKFILALLLLPFGMFFVLFYWININTWIVGHGGYKRHLENQINNIVGDPIYLWESHIVHHRHTNLSNIMLDIICGVALLVCIVASIHAAVVFQSIILVVIDILVNTGLAIGLVVCIARQKSEFDLVYKEATKVYQNKRNISQEENS